MSKRHFKIRFLITIIIPLIASSNTFAVLIYEPVNDPIVSATFSIDVAAFTAHRYVFGEQVNWVSLSDMSGGLGRYDLSDALFGTSSYPEEPLVNMGPLETGWITADIDSYFFPALASGKVGLSFCLTDTGDSMFAIDFMSLTITTAEDIITSYFGWPIGNENNGFGIGLADGEDLPAPLPISIPIGATGTGIDETEATKLVPEPSSLFLFAGGTAMLFLKRRRSSNKKENKKKIHNKRFPLSILIIISLTIYQIASTAQAEQVGNFVPDTIELSNVRYYEDDFAFSGNFAFELENAPNTGVSYLNVALDRNSDGISDACEWVIQNVPFANSDFNDYSHSVYFHLDSELLYADTYFILNDSEVEPPTGSYVSLGWSYLIDVPFEIEYLAQPGQDGNAPAAGPPATSGNRLPSGRSKVPDIPQYTNECGPTSTANSLIWLSERDKWVNKLLKAVKRPEDNKIDRSDSNRPRDHTEDEDSIITELYEAMHPGGPSDPNLPGLHGNELANGKKNFIRDHNLPLVVHGGNNEPNAYGAQMVDFIKKEIDKKQDVEMLIFWPTYPDPCDPNKTKGGGGHWLTVVDISIEGDKVTVSVVDPDDKKGTSKRAHVVKWIAKKNGKFSDPNCSAGWAVAESPEPEFDQVHVYPLISLFSPDLAVGASGTVRAAVQLNFAGVPEADVKFTKLQGNFTFNNGDISPDGSKTYITTNSNGIAEAEITGVAAGPALIEITVTGSDLSAYLFFDIIACPYEANLDGDCDVDFFDFAIFATHWLQTGCGNCGGADFSGDGNVNYEDAKIIAESWLAGT